MSDFEIKIDGLDEIQRLLATLPDDVNDRIQLELAKKGGEIVKLELKSAAPEGNNDKESGEKIGDNVVVKATPTGAVVGFKKKVWYVKLLELGTKVRTIKGKGKYKSGNRGSMTRKPFVDKAHQAAAPKVVEFLNQNYLSIVDKAIRKQLKKLKK